jgi:hypothetical protein
MIIFYRAGILPTCSTAEHIQRVSERPFVVGRGVRLYAGECMHVDSSQEKTLQVHGLLYGSLASQWLAHEGIVHTRARPDGSLEDEPDERRRRRAGTAPFRGLHLPMVMTIKRLAASVAMVCLVANNASDPAWPRLAARPAVASSGSSMMMACVVCHHESVRGGCSSECVALSLSMECLRTARCAAAARITVRRR